MLCWNSAWPTQIKVDSLEFNIGWVDQNVRRPNAFLPRVAEPSALVEASRSSRWRHRMPNDVRRARKRRPTTDRETKFFLLLSRPFLQSFEKKAFLCLARRVASPPVRRKARADSAATRRKGRGSWSSPCRSGLSVRPSVCLFLSVFLKLGGKKSTVPLSSGQFVKYLLIPVLLCNFFSELKIKILFLTLYSRKCRPIVSPGRRMERTEIGEREKVVRKKRSERRKRKKGRNGKERKWSWTMLMAENRWGKCEKVRQREREGERERVRY
jgi:hypothetical protein